MNWNLKMSMFLKMELFTKGNGKRINAMASEFRFGQMERNMKDIGKITKLMGRVNFGMQMEMYTMESGKKIKHMEKAYILM